MQYVLTVLLHTYIHTFFFNHTLLITFTVLTELKDCTTPQAVTYPEEVVILRKLHKIRDTVSTSLYVNGRLRYHGK